MTLNRILKLALNLKGVIVENADFSQNVKSRNKCKNYLRLHLKIIGWD